MNGQNFFDCKYCKIPKLIMQKKLKMQNGKSKNIIKPFLAVFMQMFFYIWNNIYLNLSIHRNN